MRLGPGQILSAAPLTHPKSFSTHMHTWVQDDGPSTILDLAVMFGDAPASNWAMRLSGFIAYLAADVSNQFQSEAADGRVAAQLLDGLREEQAADEEDPRFSLIHTFITAFIDDFSA